MLRVPTSCGPRNRGTGSTSMARSVPSPRLATGVWSRACGRSAAGRAQTRGGWIAVDWPAEHAPTPARRGWLPGGHLWPEGYIPAGMKGPMVC